jgi:hypothetical protein
VFSPQQLEPPEPLVQPLETVSLERPAWATVLPSAADLQRLSAVEAKPKWTASGTRLSLAMVLAEGLQPRGSPPTRAAKRQHEPASHHGQAKRGDFWFRENHFALTRAPSIISLPDVLRPVKLPTIARSIALEETPYPFASLANAAVIQSPLHAPRQTTPRSLAPPRGEPRSTRERY